MGGLFFGLKNQTKGHQALTTLLFFQVAGPVISKMTTANIFWTFLKIGAVLYGSGYVLFAYLEAELVSQQWLSRSDLMDAIA